MAVIDFSEAAVEPRVDREHRRSFDAFLSLVIFAVAHIALTLSSIALAFLADAKVLAWLVWLGGTLVLVVAFAAHRASVASGR